MNNLEETERSNNEKIKRLDIWKDKKEKNCKKEFAWTSQINTAFPREV